MILRFRTGARSERSDSKKLPTSLCCLVCYTCWCYLIQISTAIQLPDLYWNSTNPIFQARPPVISAWMKDRLNVFCPYYRDESKSQKQPKRHLEHSIIYKVSKWGYDNCVVDDSARIMIRCDRPLSGTRPLSITFREWSPNPGAPEFLPGNVYYFISTSNGTKESLIETKGGLCSRANMKLQIEVHGYRNRYNKNALSVGNSNTKSFPVIFYPQKGLSPVARTGHVPPNNRDRMLLPPFPESDPSSNNMVHTGHTQSQNPSHPHQQQQQRNIGHNHSNAANGINESNPRSRSDATAGAGKPDLLSDSPRLKHEPGYSSLKSGNAALDQRDAQDIAALEQIEVEIGYEPESRASQSLNSSPLLYSRSTAHRTLAVVLSLLITSLLF